MREKSFYEVLEEQVRREIRRELEDEIRNAAHPNRGLEDEKVAGAAGRLESWLTANVGQTLFKRKGAYSSYVQKQSQHWTDPSRVNFDDATPAEPAPVRPTDPSKAKFDSPRVTVQTIADLCALELLRRHSGQNIGESFSEAELKSAWKKAALKTHPDRFAQSDAATQSQMGALFQEICQAHEQLGLLFKAN